MEEWSFLLQQLPDIKMVYCSPDGAPDGWRRFATRVARYDGILQPHKWVLGNSHKPSPRLLLEIWQDWPAETYIFYGDRKSDQQCAIAAAAKGMPVRFEWAGTKFGKLIENAQPQLQKN